MNYIMLVAKGGDAGRTSFINALFVFSSVTVRDRVMTSLKPLEALVQFAMIICLNLPGSIVSTFSAKNVSPCGLTGRKLAPCAEPR